MKACPSLRIRLFANSPEFAGQMVTSLKDKAEYQERIDIRCFDKKGKLRSQVWRIGQGYEKLPEGAEIIDGILVTKETTIEEAPPTLMDEIRQLRAQIAEMQTSASKLDAMETDLADVKRQVIKQIEPLDELPERRGARSFSDGK